MKIFKTKICVTLILGIMTTAFPMTTYAEEGTEYNETIMVSSDDTLSYVDSNVIGKVDAGDIIYFGTEGLYIFTSDEIDIDNTIDSIRTCTVKKVNTSTYLQDDAASTYYAGGDGAVIIEHTNAYVEKLCENYVGYTLEGFKITKNNINNVSAYDWVYEFDWFTRHHNNTYGEDYPALIRTDRSYNEWASGYAYCRVGVKVKISDIKAAKEAMHAVNISSKNGHVNLEVASNVVTINLLPDVGYELDSLLVTDTEGNAVTLTDNKFTMPAKDVEIKASFKKIVYTVNFDCDGGSDVTSQTLESGDVITEPATPTKVNYIFEGWYCEEECITKYNFNTTITAPLRLYAKWVECEHENSFEWIIDEEATETNTGLKHEKCSLCGAVRNENTVIPSTGNEEVETPPIENEEEILPPNENQGEATTPNENENVVVPSTGVSNNIFVCIAVVLIAGCGCIVLRKTKKEEY